MKIVLSKESGFCLGVERAYKLIRKNHKNFPKPIQILGNLVHNTHVIAEIKRWQIKEIKNPEQARKGTLIIPAHGCDPKIIKRLKARGICVINTTCPKVSLVMAKAKKLFRENKKVLIFGDKNHTEVKAINGVIKNQGLIFSSLAELEKILPQLKKEEKPLGIISQTTQNKEDFKKIRKRLEKELPLIEIFPTICSATYQRQKEALRLAKKADIILIVGSPMSANSNRLFEISQKINPRTHFIDKVGEIKKQWFGKNDLVGIATGASTPDYVIKSVLERVRELSQPA